MAAMEQKYTSHPNFPDYKMEQMAGLADMTKGQPQAESEFEKQHLLGEGSYGSVVQCFWSRQNTQVAVKYINTQTSTKGKPLTAEDIEEREVMTEMEARIMERVCNHPNIVDYYGVFNYRYGYALALELMTGGTLEDVEAQMRPKGGHVSLYDGAVQAGQKNGSYDEQLVANLMLQIVSGIAHCHEKRVAHRDLKPENVLVMPRAMDGTSARAADARIAEGNERHVVRLCDFGLAAMLTPQKCQENLGTPGYKAPEQFSRRLFVRLELKMTGQAPPELLEFQACVGDRKDRSMDEKVRHGAAVSRRTAQRETHRGDTYVYTFGFHAVTPSRRSPHLRQKEVNVRFVVAGRAHEAMFSLADMWRAQQADGASFGAKGQSLHAHAPLRLADLGAGSSGIVRAAIARRVCYDERADVFAMGVLMFGLLVGSEPWEYDEYGDEGTNQMTVLGQGLENFFPPNVSKEARDLVCAMCAIEPSDRPTAKMLTRNPWMNNTNTLHLEGVERKLMVFNAKRKLRSAVRFLIATSAMRHVNRRFQQDGLLMELGRFSDLPRLRTLLDSCRQQSQFASEAAGAGNSRLQRTVSEAVSQAAILTREGFKTALESTYGSMADRSGRLVIDDAKANAIFNAFDRGMPPPGVLPTQSLSVEIERIELPFAAAQPQLARPASLTMRLCLGPKDCDNIADKAAGGAAVHSSATAAQWNDASMSWQWNQAEPVTLSGDGERTKLELQIEVIAESTEEVVAEARIPLTHVTAQYKCKGPFTLVEKAGAAGTDAALQGQLLLTTSGGVDYREFCTRLSTFVIIAPPHEDRDQVKFWFDAFDVNGDGTIGVEEFEAILSFLCFNEIRRLKVTARAFFDMVDTNHDNSIDVDEFISMVRRYHSMQKFVRSKTPSLWKRATHSVAGAAKSAAGSPSNGCCVIS